MMSEHLQNVQRASDVLAINGAPVIAGDLRRAAAYIRDLEAQLAARNQAAEAMGVLERLVEDINKITLTGPMFSDVYSVARSNGHSDGEMGEGDSLIEAVLKAGGEDG